MFQQGPNLDLEGRPSSRASLVQSDQPPKSVLTELVKRVRKLTKELLHAEESTLRPASRNITPEIVEIYINAMGNLEDALPYCLLVAREEFMWDAHRNHADHEEDIARAKACEVLAREFIHLKSKEDEQRIIRVMSRRFAHELSDKRSSDKASAIEVAVDTHCTIFLSSKEVQYVISCLWEGTFIQIDGKENDVEFISRKSGDFELFRLAIPRYQNIYNMIIWAFFLFVYSLTVHQSVGRITSIHSIRTSNIWEMTMYILACSFAFEDIRKVRASTCNTTLGMKAMQVYRLLLFVSWRAFGFWNFISFATDAAMVAAFTLRTIAMFTQDPESSINFQRDSSQCLSFVAPLIWMKLIPIFDGFKYVGTMQICVARMLRESSLFFSLLAVLSIGFIQGMYALDALDTAKGDADDPRTVMKLLVEALLQSPDYSPWEPGLLLYYLWNVATALILLNILISLFSTAYDDVVEDATAEYLAYFAHKTISMIRAPDEYFYPAPFCLVEVFFIAPLEYVVSEEAYAKINQFIMPILLFIPLKAIDVFECYVDPWSKPEGDIALRHDGPEAPVDEVILAKFGLNKKPFEDLVKKVTGSNEAETLQSEITKLQVQMQELKDMMSQLGSSGLSQPQTTIPQPGVHK
ncbi:hypothetical protein NM688_g1844 [Phlebia brevispora]|uniref:Uncharacterized protein n=1 Tax=Phlebia brevispora TaxID=194682 RepID=A0ACC1TA57_9APHY|nr:hypothetical protein NM688_g1844 [Phlebia brevispora]